ncbi:MAG: hypothetical protein IKX51_09030 [Bacteroidales bacterium]|nr:hypothetical protein [Bacteroidales bacterium]
MKTIYHTTKNPYIIANGFLISLLVLLFASCSFFETSDVAAEKTYDDMQTKIRSYEWTNFDLYRKTIDHGSVLFNQKVRFVVRNTTDSKACIAIINPTECYSVLINADSAIYINNENNEIDIFHREKSIGEYNMFSSLCGNEIGNFLSKWEVFSPLANLGTEIVPVKMKDVIIDGQKYILIKAKQKVKYCTSEACYYRYVPVNLYFDAVTGMPDSAIDASGEYKKAEIVKNINHENLQQLLDSIFDLKSKRYAKYSVNRNDSNYINSQEYDLNEVFNEEVLNFPLVNVKTGDTTTLKNFEGWTLVVFWDRYSLAAMSKEAKQDLPVDNILFISTMSDNVDFINKISDTLNIDGLLYHAKFLNRKINNLIRFYMLSPSKEVVYKTTQNSCRIIPEEWRKAKQEYEQKKSNK